MVRKVKKNRDLFFSEYSSIYRLLNNHINRILENSGISGSYWRVLCILQRSGQANFGEISKRLYIEKPALTKIIKKLTAMGIVEIRLGRDKREKQIGLTSLGEEKIDQIGKELEPFMEQVFQGLTKEQVDVVFEIMELIKENIVSNQ